jgi:hypothetical protein
MTTKVYEAIFLHGRVSPLYNGDTCLVVFELDEVCAPLRTVGWRVLSDEVTEPTDVAVEEALHDLGYAVSRAASGPAIVRDGAGWRMLVVPSL